MYVRFCWTLKVNYQKMKHKIYMEKMTFFQELSERWNANSPTFFKKLSSFGAYLTATGTGLVGIPAALNAVVNTTIDVSLLGTIASYMILAGLVIAVVSKLPVKDPEQLAK